MTDRYDAIRQQHPDLVLNLYGFTPRGPVTLEVIAPDGFRREWVGETAETVYDLAFPVEPTSDPDPAAAPDLFE